MLAVSSAGMLVRRSAWDALGGLDPRLPLFRDDIDLGWRAAAAGLSGASWHPDAVIFHAEAASRGRPRHLEHGAPTPPGRSPSRHLHPARELPGRACSPSSTSGCSSAPLLRALRLPARQAAECRLGRGGRRRGGARPARAGRCRPGGGAAGMRTTRPVERPPAAAALVGAVRERSRLRAQPVLPRRCVRPRPSLASSTRRLRGGARRPDPARVRAGPRRGGQPADRRRAAGDCWRDTRCSP